MDPRASLEPASVWDDDAGRGEPLERRCSTDRRDLCGGVLGTGDQMDHRTGTGQVLGGACRLVMPVFVEEDDHGGAFSPTEQHVVAAEDFDPGALDAGEVESRRLGTGCDDHDVGLLLANAVSVGCCVQHDPDTELIELPHEPVDDLSELASVRGAHQGVDLTAETIGLLEKGYAVTT